MRPDRRRDARPRIEPPSTIRPSFVTSTSTTAIWRRHETCHPSDNLGAVLAACEYAKTSGKELLCALAVAYQVQCRLSDEAPVRARGFDHTTQGSFAVAAGVSRALELDFERTVNAIALCGTAFNALRVTRTGALSHWKGLAYPNTAFACTHAAFLAMRGITGPREVFEGNKGFMETISGPFAIDWSQEDLERVTRTIIKKFNAEIHSQTTLEGILELQMEHDFSGQEVVRIDIDTFEVAFNIIGGGEEGDKTIVRTKEEADHSLQYMTAVALLDGQVMPEQYRPERIQREDVQTLLKKIFVRPDPSCSEALPRGDALPAPRFPPQRPGAQDGKARLRRLPHQPALVGPSRGQIPPSLQALSSTRISSWRSSKR